MEPVCKERYWSLGILQPVLHHYILKLINCQSLNEIPAWNVLHSLDGGVYHSLLDIFT